MLHKKKHKILILGVNGFIGSAIYKELYAYFRVFGTYATPTNGLEKNKQFFHYNHEEDDVVEILEATKPSIIISTLRGNFATQTIAHQHIVEYVKHHDCKIIFLSSANVFDAYKNYPSYELDKTLSLSIYGHFKIKIENMLMRLPKRKWAILRVPMVFGQGSPRIEEIKIQLKEKLPIEIFPNLIINVTTDDKLSQQIHYIINRSKSGVFHLGSTDLIHHDEFIKEIVSSLVLYKPVYKQVYTTNDDRYLAVLPKNNLLPKNLQIESKDVLKMSIL
ncbi:sugar nucleotide-binding protein [Lacinutrix sp. C3R15]|uniref:sugar nucleotide-binding protein n=1 Tax=Flavobacteriaceae TaxID=49546 RepID=UPI001C0990F3|nr:MULTISPECIES: sugar nucleotide-binding protein [Flavobacteriaceae]MBU2940130.1 sugar nucleotide-binding protein [Lacinutrix sp. C3R15]MDO6623447.1 sugar nucleotide-binding protein [Oceanihabitans sp. 1_MG-2023]